MVRDHGSTVRLRTGTDEALLTCDKEGGGVVKEATSETGCRITEGMNMHILEENGPKKKKAKFEAKSIF